jgi:poly-gamma-glutamate synthesis protein (capsule biosynthesis protein)
MKLLFVGDVMLGRLVNQVLKREPPEYPWGDTLTVLRQADCRICNLECVVSDRGRPWGLTPKAFHFRSDAKNVSALTAAGITAVSVANNHTLDFEYDAMFKMLRILDRAGIRHAGAGENLGRASQPALLEISDARIGLVAFTDNEPGWEATDLSPGVFYVPIDLRDARAAKLLETVRNTKGEVDLLILSAHWGGNWGYSPPSNHRLFARALIDAGADIIFGHSCHVVRGVEIYQGRPILYSSGNFIDDYAVDEIERNDRSLIFMLETEAGTLTRIRLYPTVIRRYQARMAAGAESEEIAAKMRQLCADLNTTAGWREKDRCLEIALR